MKIKINVVSIALICAILAVAVLYYAKRNIVDLVYLIFLITQLIRYIRSDLS